jgi:hypothetical protein
MNALAEIEARLLAMEPVLAQSPVAMADELLHLGEQILCYWLAGKDASPTEAKVEGFRLLALHRQGCKGDPSFNACRESCRELAYHYNLLQLEPEHPQIGARIAMARAVALHLCLFVGGKLQVPELGADCCSSTTLRTATA